MKASFIRRDYKRYSSLGKRRKKKQKWRNPTGRHNKIREKRRGYPSSVNVGYKKSKLIRGKIEERPPIIIRNISDLKNIKINSTIIIANVGKRKKIEIAKKAQELKMKIYNLNIKKYLKKNQKNKGENKK